MRTLSRLLFLLLIFWFSTSAEAQAGSTLLVKTDMNCDWRLDGRPMGLLKADEPRIVLVSPGEHLIEASAAGETEKSRTKVVVENVERTVAIRLKLQNLQAESDPKTKARVPKKARESTGSDTALNATWTDPATRMMWASADNGSDVDQDQAGSYCSKLQLAGYKDWRLATIEELQGIYDPNLSSRAVFGGAYAVDLHVKGNLKLTGWTWSDHRGEFPGKPYQNAWFFEFGGPPNSSDVGKPLSNFQHFSWTMRALCVRHAPE